MKRSDSPDITDANRAFLINILSLDHFSISVEGEVPVTIAGIEYLVSLLPGSCVRKRLDKADFSGKASCRFKTVCSFCLVECDCYVEFDFAETFSPEPEEEEFPAPPVADLRLALAQNLSLNLPVATLCSDDCKGLCPVCGTNRNLDTCTCAANKSNGYFDF